MSLFRQRIAPIVQQIKPTAGLKGEELTAALRHNNHLLKSNRAGDYLVRSNYRDWADMGVAYVHYSYLGDLKSYYSSGTRATAQWFTKEEAKEIVDNTFAYRMVKKSKNGH